MKTTTKVIYDGDEWSIIGYFCQGDKVSTIRSLKERYVDVEADVDGDIICYIQKPVSKF